MGLINDYKLYRSYKDILKKNRVELESNYGIRIDSADRMYTVINVPQKTEDEAYSLRKQDIDRIAESYIKEYISKLSEFLNKIGLNELYTFYEPIKKVDKYSYLIILGFKKINTVEFNKLIYFRFWPIVTISIIIYLLVYFLIN